jgi:hypothetical protein
LESPHLTRRSLLAGVAAGAGALLVAPPGAARAGASDLLFSRALGTLRGVSPVIETAQSFALAGVQWQGPPTLRVELRARLADGRWSRWVRAGNAGHGPDRPRRSAVTIGDPLWAGSADAVQLRSAAPVRAVRLHFVAVAGGAAEAAAAAAPPLAAPELPAGPGQPPIIARTAWAHGHAPPAYPPAYGRVRMGFVHHTENLNGYSAAEVPTLIYNIYLYHRYTNGWNDIGYNFVIDAFGRIWEARDGGIDLPVIGAQAGGYNEESTGVAMLGTYSDVLPPGVALRSLQRLLAWKLSLHGIATYGEVTVKVDPSDAFYTPFRPGQLVTLPRIAGHRQGCSTDCPGNTLFAHLGAVRAAARRLAGEPATLSLAFPGAGNTASTYLSLGGAVAVAGVARTVSGVLQRLGGAPIPGATVTVQRIDSGATTALAGAVTAADGSWSAPVTLSGPALVRALSAAAPAAVSPLVSVSVAAAVTLTVVSTSPLTLSGTVTPGPRKVTIELRLPGSGRVVTSKTVSVANGAFSAVLPTPGAAGSYELIARVAATRTYAAGTSAPVALTIPAPATTPPPTTTAPPLLGLRR